jgi:outer membrane protein W
MKKIILSILAVAAFGTANAQEESTVNGFSKGDKFVEGSFSFRSGDFEDSWAFNPSMGYMLDDKWAVGGRLNFGGSKDNNTNDKESVLGITGFARYYFLSLGETKSFQAFGEAGLGYSAITEDPNVGDKSTDNTLNANISIGMNYFFTSHWAATFTLANILQYNSFSPEDGDNKSDLQVEVNLFNNIFAQPQFGLLYKW